MAKNLSKEQVEHDRINKASSVFCLTWDVEHSHIM
jgi:hypothetical protein